LEYFPLQEPIPETHQQHYHHHHQQQQQLPDCSLSIILGREQQASEECFAAR